MSPTWAADATYDLTLIEQLWYGSQPWNVILPTGDLFDVWRMPLDIATVVLADLREKRRTIGPVAHTPRGEWLVFTRARLGEEPVRPPAGMPYTYHGAGDYVMAPPSQLDGATIRWWRPPTPMSPRLPRWEPVLEALDRAVACRGRTAAHGLVPVPRAG